MDDPQAVLESLRWCEDMVVVEPVFGDLVWLKRHESGKGITDCCLESDPCEYHAQLTHQAKRQTN